MSGSSLYGPFGIVNNVVNSGSIEYAALQTAAQANLNTAGFGQVNFTAGSLNTDIVGVTATAAGVNNLPTGTYFVYGSIRINSNAQRTNLFLRISINGVAQAQGTGASGYIRGLSGHNDSSVHAGSIFTVPAGATVGLMAEREATSGVVDSLVGEGQLSILRLDNPGTPVINNNLQVTFLYDGSSSNNYLHHEFTDNNSSSSWGWIVPEDGQITKIYGQGRGTSNNKDIVVYSNAIEISRTDTSGVNSIVDNVSLALSAGDEISVQMDNVGAGTSWNDPIVYLMFQVN